MMYFIHNGHGDHVEGRVADQTSVRIARLRATDARQRVGGGSVGLGAG